MAEEAMAHFGLMLTPQKAQRRAYSKEPAKVPKGYVLEFQRVEAPELQEGEILVRMEYSCVQPLDAEFLSGDRGPGAGHILGAEGVGHVVASKSAEFSEGARVCFLLRRFGEDCGCWRTEAALDAKRACIVEVPGRLGSQEVACILTPTMMANSCLRHFAPGSQIVVTGACGALGLALVQLAPMRGIRVVALVRGSERATWLLRQYGSQAVSVVDCSEPGWWDLAAELCDGDQEAGGGADAVLDGVGGPGLVQAASLVRARGRLVLFGAVAGQPDEVELKAACKRRCLSVVSEAVANVLSFQDAEKQLSDALALMAAGKYHGHSWQWVSWRKAAHALVPQPNYSPHPSQFKQDEPRIGRLLLRFD